MKKFLKILLLIILIFYALICFFMFSNQKKLILQPRASTPQLQFSNIKDIKILSQNYLLDAWVVENDSKTYVLFLHWNAGNIWEFQTYIKLFNQLKINALLVDYRWFWTSQWTINSENDLYEDWKAWLKYLLDRWIENKNIIIWGYSLWGWVASQISQNQNLKWVVLDSTFSSMKELVKSKYPYLPIEMLLKYKLESDKKIKNISAPILIIHSKQDWFIPYTNWQQLFDLANENKKIIFTSGWHANSINVSFEQYKKAIQDFLSN